ncbi:MAG: hypothetical protein AAB768_03160 [Patescibacteria group bacterium]
MNWANFLHIYQPAGQQPDILEAVVNQSYRPLLKGILNSDSCQITLNVTGALLELFDKYHYHDLLSDLKKAGELGRIEFTGSAKYHALLPFLNEVDIIRQIQTNEQTLRHYLGDNLKLLGFFPPEMAYHPKLVPILENLGYSWIILDEIAYDQGLSLPANNNLYKIHDHNLKVFFRERRLSNLIMSSVFRKSLSLKEAMSEELTKPNFVLTGMDGETFGHHRPGLEKLLFEIFNIPEFNLVTISQLLNLYSGINQVTPVISTWASSEQDIEQGVQFVSWKDPQNPIHNLQWKLFDLVNKSVLASKQSEMDIASASDHYFWASAKPWWSLEMIEDGAYQLMQIVKNSQTENLYQQIVDLAFEWQRTNKVRKLALDQKTNVQVPFLDRASSDEFQAFVKIMNELEKKSAKNGEYEAAILWRDAAFKLVHKLDIYDAVHAVDMLRIKIGHEKIEKMLDKYRLQYRRLRSGQPEQRSRQV